jgi:uncharacterized membrane protein YeaQ/YmgE (transglycosylase-associated protein family)
MLAADIDITVADVIVYVIAGLVIGALARLLIPGRQSMSIVATIVLGVIAALIGGLLWEAIFPGQRRDRLDRVDHRGGAAPHPLRPVLQHRSRQDRVRVRGSARPEASVGSRGGGCATARSSSFIAPPTSPA